MDPYFKYSANKFGLVHFYFFIYKTRVDRGETEQWWWEADTQGTTWQQEGMMKKSKGNPGTRENSFLDTFKLVINIMACFRVLCNK